MTFLKATNLELVMPTMHYLDRNIRLIESFIFKIFTSWSSWQVLMSIWRHLQEESWVSLHYSLQLLEVLVTSNVPSFVEDAEFVSRKQKKLWFLPVCSPKPHCELHWHKMFLQQCFTVCADLKMFLNYAKCDLIKFTWGFLLRGFCPRGNFVPEPRTQ